MKSLFLILAFSYAVLAIVPYYRVGVDDRVANEYALVFKYELEESVISNYVENVKTQGGSIISSFKIGKLRGVFAKLSPSLLAEHLKKDDTLRYIEENQVVGLAQSCSIQNNPIWNLERVSERQIDLTDSKGYTFETSSGAGVTSYVIDTGVKINHNEFEGRASWGFNGIDSTNDDCNGHGTHVAGTIAGRLYGVAKKTTIVAVKVLNCGGSGTVSSVVAGIEWVVNNVRKPANANMSLGGGNSAVLIEAVEEGVAAGIPFVVAAGNSNANACSYSPANAPNAITVGATTIESGDSNYQTDVRSYFSNWGICLDIFAPGQLIKSAWIGSPDATNEISGTSMASPHVCGVVSLIQGDSPSLSPEAIRNVITGASTKNTINLACGTSACNNSPNYLLFSSCDS